jgi:hypothetical protein
MQPSGIGGELAVGRADAHIGHWCKRLPAGGERLLVEGTVRSAELMQPAPESRVVRQAAPADREPENRTLEQLMRTADRKGGTVVPDHHIPVAQ